MIATETGRKQMWLGFVGPEDVRAGRRRGRPAGARSGRGASRTPAVVTIARPRRTLAPEWFGELVRAGAVVVVILAAMLV